MSNLKFFQYFIALIFVQLVFTNVNAQKKHFIYIQAEDKQPFYVMINQKNYSSSVNGHLIIPKLKNGKYFFVAGFPKEKYPEQKFTCVIEDKDQGFVLKQYGNNGWGLFNVVNFQSIMANNTEWEKEKALYDTVKLDDDVMASAAVKQQQVNTSSTIKQEAVVKKEVITETTVDIAPQYISASSERESINATQQQANQPIKANDVPINKGIIKTAHQSSHLGVDEVYIDYTTSPSDTVALFIPANNQIGEHQTNSKNNPKPINKENLGDASQYNKSCVYLASEADFGRTRKAMSLETSDDKMIATAKKTFKGKCFSTDQIKNLGLLFLAENSRLNFFKMAKPFIYDLLNFAALETQFTHPGVIQEFRKINN